MNQQVEKVPSPFDFLKILTDDKHPAVLSILYFSFFGLFGTMVYMFFLPDSIIEKKYVVILGILTLGLFLMIQYWFKVVEEAKKEIKND